MNNNDMFNENRISFAPLAERMRPTTLDEFIGQNHILSSPLIVEAIKNGTLGSVIFFGPPGTGKTTLANLISIYGKGNFEKLNAVSSGVADAKRIIDKARSDLSLFGTKTYLLLDECHRWSKAQSDSVLSAVEDGSVVLIGSTTENPYTSMTKAIVSRCKVFQFKLLTEDDVKIAIKRAIKDTTKGLGKYNVSIEKSAIEDISHLSGGDIRTALNILELITTTAKKENNGKLIINSELVSQTKQKMPMSISENEYYDILSAFCKSIRGSDAEAALYYSARLIDSGIDPLIIARRLVAHASEDIGLADSNAMLISLNALTAVEKLGLPECRLSLSHAIIYLAEAPKSNSVCVAMNMAKEDAEKFANAPVPNNLKNHSSINPDGTKNYKYPHDYGGYVYQQYMPTKLKDRVYYKPSKNGKEQNIIRKKIWK